jgi:hypothetical protein
MPFGNVCQDTLEVCLGIYTVELCRLHECIDGSGTLAAELTSVGLLIAPSAFHRIADRGKSTGRTQTITSFCAAASLLPFAVALGIDITIGLTCILRSHVIGIAAGAGFALTGIAAWYGLGWIMRRHQGAEQRHKAASDRHATETAPLHSRIEQMLTEARVILPGAQAGSVTSRAVYDAACELK